METIQEAFLMLNISNLKDLPTLHRYALILHAINLQKGFVFTGFQEDDPQLDQGGTATLSLPDDWLTQNAEVVSFRYRHPSEAMQAEYYFKFLQVGDNQLAVNALCSARNDEIVHCEIEMKPELVKEAQFVNLDSWVGKSIMPTYEKEVLNKLIKKKPEEEKKDDRRQPPAHDPFPLGGGIPTQPHFPSRPLIIGDPVNPSPLFIPPSFRPPGTSGPGGDLVGPGSQIFWPHGYDPTLGIDPATGGGIPIPGGDDPSDINPTFPSTNPLFGGRRNPFPNPNLPGGFGNPFGPPFGGGPGFSGGPGFGGGGFYS